jgi:hypothetical protein
MELSGNIGISRRIDDLDVPCLKKTFKKASPRSHPGRGSMMQLYRLA